MCIAATNHLLLVATMVTIVPYLIPLQTLFRAFP